MISRHPAVSVGLLIWLALILQSSRLPAMGGLELDLVFLLVVLCAFRWKVAGGLLAGLWGGVLVSAVAGGSWTLASLYLGTGLVAAALREAEDNPGFLHHAGMAVSLTALFLASRASLLEDTGLMALGLDLSVHTIVLTGLLETARRIPVSPSDGSTDNLQNLILR